MDGANMAQFIELLPTLPVKELSVSPDPSKGLGKLLTAAKEMRILSQLELVSPSGLKLVIPSEDNRPTSTTTANKWRVLWDRLFFALGGALVALHLSSFYSNPTKAGGEKPPAAPTRQITPAPTPAPKAEKLPGKEVGSINPGSGKIAIKTATLFRANAGMAN